MCKNKRYQRDRNRFHSVLTATVFGICLLGNCAQSHQRTDTADGSDGKATDIADSGLMPDSDQSDVGDTLVVRDSSFRPTDSAAIFPPPDFPGFEPPPDPPEPPIEIREAMETLDEPDFARPIEELGDEHCGYIFRAESTVDWTVPNSSQPDTKTNVETRLFDSSGRLIAAEIEWDSNYATLVSAIQKKRRLQIDYDQAARPIRVRISPAYSVSETMFTGQVTGTTAKGSVIITEYQSDGSSQSLYITDEVDLVTEFFDSYTVNSHSGSWLFCDWLRFDPRGNLIDRKWNCNDPTAVQTRTYDDQGRLLSDRGYYLYNLDQYQPFPRGWFQSMQTGQWRIEVSHDDANHQTTMVWRGPEGSSHDYIVAGTIPSDEPIEHRLLDTYDGSGQRLVRREYDHENDGVFDEQVSYTYENGELLSKEVDFWMDGIVDIIELHTRSKNHHRVERRNMTDGSDVLYSSRTPEDHIYASFADTHSTLPPRSQSIVEMRYDDQSRRITSDLEIQMMSYNPVNLQQVVVSESWHEKFVFADEGYVSEKDVFWEPSEALLEAQANDSIDTSISDGTPYLFGADNVSTRCTLTPLCDNAEVNLPEDPRLLVCEAGVVFPQYRMLDRLPSLILDDLYQIPPYDRLPGMQNAQKRCIQSYAFPLAPFIQDLVDYL